VEINPLWMFALLLFFMMCGYSVGFVMGGTALLVGLLTFGPGIVDILVDRVFHYQTHYLLIACPLFLLMGQVLGQSGLVDNLYGALHVWMGRLRGGLAVATVTICTIFAAATGIVSSSVVAMGLIAFPSMLKRGYDKKLAGGSVMAGGALGVLIPPSVLLVLFGVVAEMSVGKLFFACFVPGLVLSSLYIGYILLRSFLQPEIAPAVPEEETRIPITQKVSLLVKAIIPPVLLIVSVLGSILFGVATPTEAAGVGAVGAIIITAFNRRLNWPVIKNSLFVAVRTWGMICIIVFGATSFVGVFTVLGGGKIVEDVMMGLPFGTTGSLIVMLLILFILGMFIDPGGIVMLCAPLFVPIAVTLGFNQLWFAVVFNLVLQMSFLTPPFGFALFFLKAVAPPGVTMVDLIKGGVPFVGLQAIGTGVIIAFPVLALWLPGLMIS